ncbi:MAG: hypothetical protein LQ340_007881, partial [Diploschistes diacapsis]
MDYLSDLLSNLGNLLDPSTGSILGVPRASLRLATFWAFAIAPLLILVSALIVILVPTSWDDNIPAPTGCKKIGLKKGTNLSDEHEAQPTDSPSPTSAPNNGPFRVKSLWIYPVKSCRGIELASTRILATGPQYDRVFSLAYLHRPKRSSPSASPPEPEWRFLTQRQNALLSQITTELWIPSPQTSLYSPTSPSVLSGGAIILTFPHPCRGISGLLRRSLSRLLGAGATAPTKSALIPLSPSPSQIEQAGYPTEKFHIWKDTPLSLNMGSHLPPELALYLGFPAGDLTLFRILPHGGGEREVHRCAPRKEELGWQPVVGFADAYPVNILGAASVRALSAMQRDGAERLSVVRFRPNVVFDGGARAFEEDAWRRI